MVIRIRLLGPPEVSGPGGAAVTGCAQSLQLLAYLATRPGRAAERESLGHSLWPDADPERMRARLNTALWRLRKMVVEAGPPAEAVLDCAGEIVALRSDAPLWLDIEELRRCWRLARRAGASALSTDAVQALDAGTRLYRGSFLPGHDEEWSLIERESLTAAYQAILDRLLEHHLSRCAWRAVIETARQMLALDPLLENAHRAAIRAHGSLGERAQAARQFLRCRTLLAQELDVAPLPETEAALRAALSSVPASCADPAGAPPAPSLAAVIGSLKAALRELERLNRAG